VSASVRRNIAIGIGIGAVLVALDLALPGDASDALGVATVVILIASPIGCLIASRFVWGVYMLDERRPRSWVLRLLLSICIACSVLSFPLAGLGLARAVAFRVPTEIATDILAISVLVIVAIPSYIADTIRQRIVSRLNEGKDS
jgi:hypothetical protein